MKEINTLVYTSADDLRSQIKYFKSMGKIPSVETLQSAHALCIQHGYKTKANLLAALIKKISKEVQRLPSK